MRIVYLTAGASGMFCGSCMRDNTLASALIELGHDALLVPTYTPITTDEVDVSAEQKVFFGGVNVFLQQSRWTSWLFRRTPRFIDGLFNNRAFLRWVGRFAGKTDYSKLGGLTLSMLQGTHGNQRKEVFKLVEWLEREIRPEVIVLTNVLLSGIVPELSTRLKRPIIATLQGDDIFLDVLPENDRQRCIQQIQENDRFIDGYIVTSEYYANFMSEYLGIPRDKMHIIYPGINRHGFSMPVEKLQRPPTIGYFARICPEKGLHHLIDAFIELKQESGMEDVRLHFSGWLGEKNQPYYEEQWRKLRDAGLDHFAEYTKCPDHATKAAFLQGIDVFSVPTVYHEPKGLYVLEAWATGLPVVLPRHGTFPELIEMTQAGVLVEPNNPTDLARALQQLLNDSQARQDMGLRGHDAVQQRFQAQEMAQQTQRVLEQYLTKNDVREQALSMTGSRN